jgi:predicted deacetylase
MSPSARYLIVSLHDVAPVHLQRMRRAEALFRALGINRVQYLFVPSFHGRYRASEYPEFLDWCRRDRSFQVSWWLHGYYHQERPSETELEPLSFTDRLKRRFLTAGEGEFLTLDAAMQRQRLKAGLEEFSHCFQGAKAAGFVPPAWLFKPAVLLPLLKELELPYTEDHRYLYNVNRGATLPAPVITWATRTWFHKYGSLLVCPLRAQLFHNVEVVRVALHPHDFDHLLTARNIEQVLRRLKKNRILALPETLDWGR